MDDGIPTRLQRARDFWEASARGNARYAILGEEVMRDGSQAETAFRVAGRRDLRLAWFLHPGARVLDLGCGIGRVMKELAPYCGEIIGVDIAPEMVREARKYLTGVPNARAVLTDGWSFPGIEDASVDFVFSLLCLIHVDKRSAYRYFEEIHRVLRPGGLALLQFLDILSKEGLRQFVAVVERDDPLEFYAAEEVSMKLKSAGLGELTSLNDGPHLNLVALRGDPEEWKARFREDVFVAGGEGEGVFGASGRASGDAGRLRLAVTNRGALPRTLRAFLALGPPSSGPYGPAVARAEGFLFLDPRSENVVEFTSGGDAPPGITLNGKPAALLEVGCDLAPGPEAAMFHVALMPPGFPWREHSLKLFPGFYASYAVGRR